jgi:hypothetical protein
MSSDLTVFCAFLFLACTPLLGVIAGVLWNHHFARETLHWSRTQGVIEESDVRIMEAQGEEAEARFFAEVRYAYRVGTSTLRNNEIWLNSEHEAKTYEDAERFTERYFVGREITAFFNPRNPAQAVLDPGFHAEAYLSLFRRMGLHALWPSLILGALLFLVISRGLAHLVGLP